MAVKAGQVLIDANGFVVDRVQTGGITNLNVPTEIIYEVGNPKTVGIVRDIPDLTFEVQSLDVSTDIEALMLGLTPSSVVAGPGGTVLDFTNAVPLDVISPFRSANNRFDIIRGVLAPYLSLESVAYKFGIKANAEETFTLRGDSVYYAPNVPWWDVTSNAGSPGTLTFANGPATVYHEQGIPVYALAVCWVDHTTGLFGRLFHGSDYTDTSTTITILNNTVPTTAEWHVSYSSNVARTFATGSTSSVAVKPAAVKAKDIDIYLSNGAATPTLLRLGGVQTFDATWKVTFQADQEFGNPHYLAQDYDTPSVTGQIVLKNVDPIQVFKNIAALSGTTAGEVAGPLASPPLAMEARISHPDTGVLIKTIYIPDATFTAPPVSSKVKAYLDTTFKFESDTGSMTVYKGAR